MKPEGSLPHSQSSATRPYPGLAQSSPHAHPLETLPPEIRVGKKFTSELKFCLHSKHCACKCFLTWMFYREGLLAPRPTPKLEDHPSSAVRDCLFYIFAATLHIGGRSSIRNLRTRRAVVTGTHYRSRRHCC